MPSNKAKRRKVESASAEAPSSATESLVLPPKRMSDDPLPVEKRWINKQRCLVFATRGINHRHRHLMEDIKRLMPHHKPESKMERTKNLSVINEVCEMKNCNKCLLFEGRKMRDLYLWAANVQKGPSVKFLVENVYTMQELKMTGNCLRGSRPILSFDPQFTKSEHWVLLKELLTQIFGVPNFHPKCQPFFDHVYTFMILDNRIWFRNYQILTEDGALAEIGPRFVLNPVKIFNGSFGGETIWENINYKSPSKLRQLLTKKASYKYINRVEQKAAYEVTRPATGYPELDGAELFHGDPLETAEAVIKDEAKKEETQAAMEAIPDENEPPHRPLVLLKKQKRKKNKSKPKMNGGGIQGGMAENKNGVEKAKTKKPTAIRRKQLKAIGKSISDKVKKRKNTKK